MGYLSYNLAESRYIEDSWGSVSIEGIAKKLNRPIGGIRNKRDRLGLGAYLDSGDYITINQFFMTIGRSGGYSYTLNQWVAKGFSLKSKKVMSTSYKIVYLNQFWNWADKNRMHINFAKFKKGALGLEPVWVKEIRTADKLFSKYKVTAWSINEDNHLKSLLKLYRYTYKRLSQAIFRTEGSIKRRMVDLNIRERPLREDSHNIWSEEQINIVIKMYYSGYRSEVIKNYVDKSAQAIGGKIERLIKDRLLTKWK